jgi:hypothetical protein
VDESKLKAAFFLFFFENVQWPEDESKLKAVWLDHCGGVSTRLAQVNPLRKKKRKRKK